MTAQEIKVYDVKMPGWANTLAIRGLNAADAIGFARLNFKVPSDGEITATLADAPAPAPAPAPASGKRGRPTLAIAPSLICDALKKQKSVKGAARELNVSRGYIYAALGAAKVRSLVKV